MQAESFMLRARLLTVIIPLIALAGCGEGSGQARIPGTVLAPLPDVPFGFCDPVNFEILCEGPAIVNFNGGATILIDNPDRSGINVSDRVARMQKFPDEVFGGTRLDLPDPIDFSLGEVYKVKVWSARPVPVLFKLEQLGNPNGGQALEQNHSGSGTWEELCFDFTGQSVPPPVFGLTIIFENGTQGGANTNPPAWTFYYDDITQVETCSDAGAGTGTVPDVTLYDPAGSPDLESPDDYAEISNLDSGSVINEFFADDETFSPVLAVSSGTGLGANVGQIAYTGFEAGFASAFESLDFKVKGMPNFVIFVGLYDGVDRLRLNLSSSSLAEELDNGWYQVSIPLSRFEDVEQATGIVFESDDSAAAQFTFLLSDIGFSGSVGTGGGGTGGGGTGGGGTGGSSQELVVNGDFETGDLAGWTTFLNGGTIATSGPGSTGMFAVNLDASGGPRNPTLKQSNLGAGQLTAGQAATLSFDWKGSAAVGGVVDVVLFSETSTGGPSQTEQILSGADFPADWTSVGPLTFNLGPDVSGGITLQITAICGGDTTCVSDLSFDNISITADVADTGGGTGGGGTGGGGTGGGGTGGGGTGGGGTAAGDIAVNGGFEDGSFDGWVLFPNGGTQTITTDNPSSGSFAANLVVPVRGEGDPAVDNLIKNANLEAGNLTPGASVTVNFDMRGSLSGAGGVVFAELFSELAGGGTSKAEIFTGGPLTPNPDWTTYSFMTTLGPDVDGGVTLQLKTSCGPVVGCGVDAFFDNISIVLN